MGEFAHGQHRYWALIALLLAATTGCADTQKPTAAADSERSPDTSSALSTFGEVFEEIGRITLAEPDGILTLLPYMRSTSDGGVLVTDREAQQLRRYDPQGNLVWYVTSEELGVDWLPYPAVALEASDSTVFIVDRKGRGLLWNWGSRDVVSTSPAPLELPIPTYFDDIDIVADSLLLYSARIETSAGGTRHALHLVNRWTGRYARALLAPPVTDANRRIADAGIWTMSAVRGDTIATVSGLTDTLYLHTSAGQLSRRIPLPSTEFRRMNQVQGSDLSLREWTALHSYADEIYWSPSTDGWIVEYVEYEYNLPRYHLLNIDRNGQRRFEIRHSPRLHFVAGDVFYFDDPGELDKNHLLAVRLK